MKQKNNTTGQRVKGSKAKLYALVVPLFLYPFVLGSLASPDNRVVFTDITEASGIKFKHTYSPDKKYILESMSGGVALVDYDNDGWLDVYFVNAPTVAQPSRARSELWHNQGDGTFSDVTDKAGVGSPGWGMGVCAGDYNNDGWEDLYVTCFGANRLYRNNGDGTFTDVAAKAGVADPRWSTGAAFGDYNNDGLLDLFVANYVDLKLDALPEFGKGKHCQFQGLPVQCGPQGLKGAGDSLFRNNGDGTFTDVSKQAGVADAANSESLFGLGVAWCDFNEDGFVDLYVANDTGANYLYQNKGNGTFSEIGLMSGAALSEDGKGQASMGVAIGDYDHRGKMNLFVTNFSDEYNAFYRLEKNFTFTDVSYATQTGRASLPYVGWGCGFFDYDNDGWLDLLAVNGHVYPQLAAAKLKIAYAQRKLFYRNQRNGAFAETAAGEALNDPAVSRGAAFGDLDNDGDVDVVINNLDGAPNVLRNDGGNQRNFLSINLIGAKSNRSAFGARVKVTAGDLVQVAERRSGGSYLSHNDARLHFGLEKRAKVDLVEIRWPNGAVEMFKDIPANSLINIKEGDKQYGKRATGKS